MTRHTRSKQLIKLAMMQGEDVKYAKWNYSPGHNLTIEYARKIDRVIDSEFKWYRSHKLKFVPVYRYGIRKPEFKSGVTLGIRDIIQNSIKFSSGASFKYMKLIHD